MEIANAITDMVYCIQILNDQLHVAACKPRQRLVFIGIEIQSSTKI